MDCLAIILTNNTWLRSRKCLGRSVLFWLFGLGPGHTSHLEYHENTQLLAMLSSFLFELCRATVGNGSLLNDKSQTADLSLLPSDTGFRNKPILYREKDVEDISGFLGNHTNVFYSVQTPLWPSFRGANTFRHNSGLWSPLLRVTSSHKTSVLLSGYTIIQLKVRRKKC